MKILINLISGQTYPNYFAFLYSDPHKIINLYSEDTIKALENLNSLIKSKKNVDIEDIKVNPFDYNNIYSVCDSLNLRHNNDEIILNYTGGTKIMSLAAYEFFKQFNRELIYFNSQSNTIIITNKNNKNAPVVTQPMNFNTINVEEHLKLNGFSISIQKVDYSDVKKRIDLTEFIFKLLLKTYKKGGLKKLLNVRHNIESYIPESYDQKKLLGNSNEIKQYYSLGRGGWFEEFTFNELYKLNYFDSISLNLKVNTENCENEFDVYALKNGNLYLFECKVGQTINNFNLSKIKENALRCGGKFAKCFLVFLILTPTMRKAGEEMGITIIETFKNRNFLKHIKLSENKASL